MCVGGYHAVAGYVDDGGDFGDGGEEDGAEGGVVEDLGGGGVEGYGVGGGGDGDGGVEGGVSGGC